MNQRDAGGGGNTDADLGIFRCWVRRCIGIGVQTQEEAVKGTERD